MIGNLIAELIGNLISKQCTRGNPQVKGIEF